MDENPTVKLVLQRQQKLEKDRSLFDSRMQDVADFVCPFRDDIKGTNKKGQKKGDKIFDGTAVSAAVLAADGIHGYHVSPAFPWFKHEFNRKEVNKIPEIREFLQEVDWNMYMALNRSNFYGEMWRYIYDGFGIGTASIFPEEDLVEEKIIFEAEHPGEIYVAENKYGEVDIRHRKRQLQARQIYQRFGKENCPDIVKQALQTSPFQEFEVIHAVYPREQYDTRKKNNKNKRYASSWVLSAGSHLLKESGFDDFPCNVWRYLKTGKEPYGTSPAHLAMSDIKGINLMSKTIQGAAQLAVDPAYNIPEYLEGKVQLKPRGFNYIRGNDAITPVNTGSQYPVGIDREQAKQQAIRERFHVDTFLMLTQLADQGGQRTATEVMEMVAEKAAILGAELGPLNYQLDKILDRVYQIESQAGRMPAPPDILLEMAETDPHLRFDPVYVGPLAQAQRERFASDWVVKFMAKIGPMVEVQPSILDNFDLDEGARSIARTINIPAEVIKDREKVEEFRQAKAEAMQAEQEKEDLERLASGVKDVASIDKQGTLIDSVVNSA